MIYVVQNVDVKNSLYTPLTRLLLHFESILTSIVFADNGLSASLELFCFLAKVLEVEMQTPELSRNENVSAEGDAGNHQTE